MKVALYEEGKYWDAPDIKRVFTSVEAARQIIPDGFEIKRDSFDVYAENEYLERYICITKYKVESCHNCTHLSTRHHELDPLGEWKWCELHEKDVLEDSHWCPDFEQTRWDIEGRVNMTTN